MHNNDRSLKQEDSSLHLEKVLTIRWIINMVIIILFSLTDI